MPSLLLFSKCWPRKEVLIVPCQWRHICREVFSSWSHWHAICDEDKSTFFEVSEC